MFSKFLYQILKARDLRSKILFILFIFVIFRLVAHIPVPGPDPVATREFLSEFFASRSLLGLLDFFSGGAVSNFSVAMMGLSPYINASIIMQLMTIAVPKLEALSKEGKAGYEKINQYARYLTVPLAALQGYGMLVLIRKSSAQMGKDIIGSPSISQWVLMIVAITAGTIFIMWLGELITEKGIGNGISLLIFAGILSRVPISASQALAVARGDTTKMIGAVVTLVLGFLVILAIVYMEEARRNIPISYARQVRGMRMFGGVDTHLPLRLNSAGVIPIIFAMSFMFIPNFIGNFFSGAKTAWVADSARAISNFFQNNLYYSLFYFFLVVGFTYFYTAVVFKPPEVAENLQKQGGFIPGIRPGKETIQFLRKILYRITLFGALFLGLVAILPYLSPKLIEQIAGSSLNAAIGGTGILIVVSVAIETYRQIKAQLVMRSYEQY